MQLYNQLERITEKIMMIYFHQVEKMNAKRRLRQLPSNLTNPGRESFCVKRYSFLWTRGGGHISVNPNTLKKSLSAKNP